MGMVGVIEMIEDKNKKGDIFLNLSFQFHHLL
jgi:hypothetical protein